MKQPHTDTRALSDSAQMAFREVEPSLPADVVLEPNLYQLRDFIDRGVYNVGESLVIGAALVLIVLFVFLLNLRTTFISLAAIPLSLVVTVLMFKLIGAITGTPLSINIMTLGGIAVAMGELVDDAIVDVENIFRRLRENNHSSTPKSALLVVYEASAEVRSSIVFGTAVVILVVSPSLRSQWNRGPVVYAAWNRLYRLDSGLAFRFAHRHAGSVVLPPGKFSSSPSQER